MLELRKLEKKLDPSGVVNHSHVNHQDMAFLAQAEQYDDIEAARKAVGAVFETIQSCSNGSRKPYGTLLYLRSVSYTHLRAHET